MPLYKKASVLCIYVTVPCGFWLEEVIFNKGFELSSGAGHFFSFLSARKGSTWLTVGGCSYQTKLESTLTACSHIAVELCPRPKMGQEYLGLCSQERANRYN